jgi:small-conductance mechanosensitive channel
MENPIPTLSDIAIRQSIFYVRPDVQFQLGVILLCLLVSWLLSKRFWRWLQKKFPLFTTFDWRDSRLSLREYGAVLLQNLDFPVIGIILLSFSRILFDSQDWTGGILRVALTLMVFYTGYRFFLATLYCLFPVNIIRIYQARLLTPLIFLFIFLNLTSLSGNLNLVSQTVLFKIFGGSVTIGSIFWLIAGLYFWMVTVFILEDIFLAFFRSKTILESGTTEATLLLMRYFLIALGIVIILGYVGVNGTAVAAITGGLSVGIGFGLQQVVSNFVSGILLLFEGVLRPGDIINVDGDTCQVKKLGIRATTVLRLIDNSEQIIPNQTFFTSKVTTYTGSDRLVYCSIVIGVDYNAKAEQVIELLLQMANQHPKILQEPEPLAFFLNFGDSSLNFELKFWIDDVNIKKRVISDLNCLILDTFAQHNIEIPFPQQDIHIRSRSV